MIPFVLLACTDPDDSAAVDDTGTKTDSGETGGETGESDSTDLPAHDCPSWMGWEPDRVWTYELRDATTDTVAQIQAWVEAYDPEAGSLVWWWSQDVDYGDYQEGRLESWTVQCETAVGASASGGSSSWWTSTEDGDYTTEASYSFTPSWLMMPANFSPGLVWEANSQVDQVVDGEASSGELWYSFSVDQLETIETPAGLFDAAEVHVSDKTTSTQIRQDWYADGFGLVGTEFTLVSEIVTMN